MEGPLAPGAITAAKRIVVSARESYLYFGGIAQGLREGRGRTQMANGCTAYEGGYRQDKRDGFGPIITRAESLATSATGGE